MIPPPPRSTLFPYTTLFRSVHGHLVQMGRIAGHCGVSGFEPALEAYPGIEARRDRKSTRLNSSHSQISYAVFCLKKKKKNKGLITSRTFGTGTRHPCGSCRV